MRTPRDPIYAGHRYPAEIISYAVWLYFRFPLSRHPGPLQDRLAQLANRPHTYLPLQAFNEADGADQLFQYYLLDTTGFEPNVFTTIFPGVNDHVQLTVTGHRQLGICRLTESGMG
jgi:hypothetical protein